MTQSSPIIPRPVRLLTFLLLGGGTIGALTSFFLLPGNWPWAMPPLAFRFLTGAAAAYAVGSLITLTHKRWRASELLLVTVIIYGVALGLAVLMQSELIDWSRPVAWTFIGLVVLALLISIFFVWKNRDLVEASKPLTSQSQLFLLILSILSGIVGLLVFFVPRQAGFLWPWAALDVWKPLDSRLIASMLLTISGGALLVRSRNNLDSLQVFTAMLSAYCIIASIGLLMHASTTPQFVVPDLVYATIFLSLTLMSIVLYVREMRTEQA